MSSLAAKSAVLTTFIPGAMIAALRKANLCTISAPSSSELQTKGVLHMRFRTTLATFLALFSLTSYGYAEEAATVADGKNVTINYTLKVDGEVVDSTEGKEPFQYTQGEGVLLPALEKELTGLKEGEHRDVKLPADKAFGKVHEEAVLEVPKTQLPEGNIEIGTILATQGPNGMPLRGTIKEIKDDSVVLDFNHPLAGKELNFSIDVLEIS